ncbi:MAG: alpha-galactosidase [Bacteroidales bacterium]|nr:alpha-galactosidase [Bacteroidales bacterium]
MKTIYLKFSTILLISLLSFSSIVIAQDSKTPMMGWSSWNTFRINISETLIEETADAMISKGLKDAGYNYVNVDDGFFHGRDAQGNLLYNTTKFPNGMKVVADYIHSKGLKAGIYSDGGIHTCAFQYDGDTYGKEVGMKNHEDQDAKLYFDTWDYDFIKLDFCGGTTLGLDEQTQYERIYEAIQKTDKKDVRFNICRWMFPGTWASEIAGSWRISHDILNQFDTDRGVRGVLEKNLYLAAYASPGHFNDMDMMQIGRNTFTKDQEKSHFGLWCIMSSPLLIGCDLRSIPESTLEIITNPEVIALNQDVLGLQAELVNREGKQFTLAKQIEEDQGKVRAVALFNCESTPKTMRINFKDIQLSEKAQVRDLWERKDLGEFSGYYEITVPAYGTAMLRIEGESSFDKVEFEAEYAFINEYDEVKIDKNQYSSARFSPQFGASGNYILTALGGNNKPGNWAEFRRVYSSEGGKYKFKLFYYSGEDRNLTVTVNGKEYQMTNLNSGGAGKRGRAFIDEIELKKGYNTIRLSNAAGLAPDIDKFVLLDPNDPGDDNEEDVEIDDEIIVNTNFPTISSEDESDETWYYIQFRNQNGVFHDMGEDSPIETKQKVKGSDAQLWKVTGTSGNYTIVNKSGRKISFADSRFQTSSTASVKLNILASNNTTYRNSWEIQRVGQSQCMNQFGGAGLNVEIGEWTRGDNGNPLLFINAERALNFLPVLSTAQNETWYYIQFSNTGKVIQDMGLNQPLEARAPLKDKDG